MTEAIRQQECLNALKTFNNSIVTIRLYPANAPQIANAIERGYKTVKQYLRQYGDLTFAIRGNEPELCGEILDSQALLSISNLIVFRHLTLLQTNRLRISPGLDRATFKKILEVFSAKVDQIRQEGGGWAFITRLGLTRNFADPNADDEDAEAAVEAGFVADAHGSELEVRKEFVDVLLGREQRSAIVVELRTILADPAAGAPVPAAAMLGVLEGMVQKKLFVTSSALEQILENCGRLINSERARTLVDETAAILLKKAELPSIALLMCQDLRQEIGKLLRGALEQRISIDLFGLVIVELRQAATRLRQTQSPDSRQLQFVVGATERLLASPKGKQFLGQEKAKSIIEAGERTRRARRVEAGVKSLLQGSDEVLQSEEFNKHLPLVLQKMEAEGMEREIRAVLAKVAEYFLQADGNGRDKIISSLAQIAENLATANRFALLQIIYEPLLFWLKNSENGDFIYEKVCQALYGLMSESWRSGEFAIGDEILSILYQIRSGAIRRPAPVRAIIGRAQDKGLDRALMKQLLDQCLAVPKDEVLSRRLILQGPIATRFLVDSLIHTEESKDRVKIIDLLTYGEQFLPAILLEKLAEPMPWYGKRNLLKLLGDTGSTEHLEVVFPFLQHEDLRVQREAFICLYKISGKRRKEVLLRALNECGETMKLQVVRALMPFGDAEVASGLAQVLEEHRFYSEELRDALLANVCHAVARCPHQHAEKILQKFIALRNDRTARKIGVNVWQAAEEALELVYEAQQDERQLKAKAGQLRKSLLTKVGTGKTVGNGRRLITGLGEERAIRELLDGGDREKAKQQLLDLISRTARLRRLSQAEQLREWLIEIDSLALGDILRAAEIIELARNAAVDKGHAGSWSELFDMLTTEEYNTFYHALEHRRFQDEENILKKGSVQNALYFINSGKVKLYHRDKDREVLVTTLGSGQVLGTGSFFDATVWTFSASALGQVEVSVLAFEKMKLWSEKYPELEPKIRDFCRKFDGADKLFQEGTHERRKYERYPTPALRLAITLLDESGKGGVAADGELADLSRGGGSFFMQISKRENARLLLGRSLRLTLPIEQPAGRPITFSGVIVAVRAHRAMENEYMVHVGFDSVLDNDVIQQILRLF